MIVRGGRRPGPLRLAGCRLLLGRSFGQAAAVSGRTEWLSGAAIREHQWSGVLELLQAARTTTAFHERRLGRLGNARRGNREHRTGSQVS